MKFEDFLKNSAIIITLVTAYFYCCSSFYVSGYFNVLELDSDVLERTFHSIVFEGFELNLEYFILIPYFLFIAFFLKAMLVISLKRFIKKIENARKVIKIKCKALKLLGLSRRRWNHYERPHVVIVYQLLGLFIACTVLLFVFGLFEQDGKRTAYIIKNKINDVVKSKADGVVKLENLHPFRMVSSLKSESVNELYFLYCGSRMCAGFDVDNFETVYFPQSGFRLKRGLVSHEIR
ncbi:hypothetical protein PQI64_15150 [Shewanella bicestrii]